MAAFLFVTDLDHTLVGDDHAMAELNYALGAHRHQHGTTIVYSTGRSLTSYPTQSRKVHARSRCVDCVRRHRDLFGKQRCIRL